jgi:hypothetical protein
MQVGVLFSIEIEDGGVDLQLAGCISGLPLLSGKLNEIAQKPCQVCGQTRTEAGTFPDFVQSVCLNSPVLRY